MSAIQRQHRSRKVRRCADCGGTIEVGEVYVKNVILPGEVRYQIAPDDWESDEIPFGTADTHTYYGSCI